MNKKIVFQDTETVACTQADELSISGAEDILIQTKASIVSAGTELSIWAGLESWAPLPNTPGYGSVGEVLEVGEAVEGIAPGDVIFLLEGKNMLIEHFGKEYAIYFSILSAIARGENTRRKIEAIVRREIGGYLTKMERDHGLISKNIPIYSKVETKNVRYVIEDNFLTFWFRFIFKYTHIIEIRAYRELIEIISRDYQTFSGKFLERYFRSKFIEEQAFTRIGGYWDRRGASEIDLIAVNEREKRAEIIEVKHKADNINLERLKEKGYHFKSATGQLKDFQITFRGLSMSDM